MINKDKKENMKESVNELKTVKTKENKKENKKEDKKQVNISKKNKTGLKIADKKTESTEKEDIVEIQEEKTKKLSKKKIFNNLGVLIEKKLKLSEEKFNLLELILLIVISFIFGIFISEAFIYNDVKIEKFESNKVLSEIEKVYNTIIDEYYTDLNQDELKKSAVNGMLNYLKDGYSTYIDEESSKEFTEQVDGEYYGIGLEMTLGEDGYPYISKIFDNTPAYDAELNLNDKIIKVEGQDIKGKNLNEVSSIIKGEENKSINITVLRSDIELEKQLVTKKIHIPSVSSRIIEKDSKKIGYIDISIFALNTDEQFKKSLEKLEEEGMDSLIIDVRDNVGGHLSTVANILNLFFNKDEVLYQIDRKGVIEKTYGVSNDVRNYKIVVLTNYNSASGSEILASAFKESKNSEIIGTKTFGKGTVQKLIELDNGSMMKITSETWLTSKGNFIDKEGVSPTIEIELSKEYKLNPTDENDNQLQKALEIIINNNK